MEKVYYKINPMQHGISKKLKISNTLGKLFFFVVVLFFSGNLNAKNIYVSFNGSNSSNGSLQRPYSFDDIIGVGGGKNPVGISPGDTIFLRGGTYKGYWWLQLYGKPGAPVTLMPYQDERVIFDGYKNGKGGGQPTMLWSGTYTNIVGLEFTNSDKRRVSREKGSFPDDITARQALFINADNSKLVNCIIYDNTSGGLLFNDKSLNSELYGNIIFNNGWESPDRGHGHAMYVRNKQGTKVIKDNIVFNSVGRGISGYGDIEGFKVVGNTSFNAGIAYKNGGDDRNFFFGGSSSGDKIDDLYIEDNVSFHEFGGRIMDIGYAEADRNRQFVSITNNHVIGDDAYVSIKDNFKTAIKRNNNTSMVNEVIIRPNKYEKGRANITVLNKDGDNFVEVDLSDVISVGAKYEILDVQNILGKAVVSGTFNGGKIKIPLNLTTVAKPNGNLTANIKHTSKEFNAFVVRSNSTSDNNKEEEEEEDNTKEKEEDDDNSSETGKTLNLTGWDINSSSLLTLGYDAEVSSGATVKVRSRKDGETEKNYDVNLQKGRNGVEIDMSDLEKGSYDIFLHNGYEGIHCRVTKESGAENARENQEEEEEAKEEEEDDSQNGGWVNLSGFYPNPVSGRLNVGYDSEVACDALVRVRNMQGEVKKSFYAQLKKGRNDLEIEMSDLENGIYDVFINNGYEGIHCKIIKK